MVEWYVFALGSALTVALVTVIEKKTLLKEHAMEFSTVFALFNLLVSLPLLVFVDFNIPLNILTLIYGVSVIGAVAFLYLAKAIRHMEISITSPLMNLQLIVLFLLAVVTLRESPSLWQISGIILIATSAYFLESAKHFDLLKPMKVFMKSKYTHFIFIAIILYSLTGIGDKIILSVVTPVSYILIAQFFIAINFLIMITIFHDGLKGIKHGIKSAWKPILLASVFIVSSRLMLAQAVSLTFVSLVIPIKRLGTLFSAIIGGEMFHEKHLLLRSILAAIMVFGSYLIVAG